MPAKNSGATSEQYEQYNEDKRKAGEPVARRVVLEVWRSEDKLPDVPPCGPIHEDMQLNESAPCLVWSPDAMPTIGYLQSENISVGGVRCWNIDGDIWEVTGTSWAYIPDIEEAT